MPRRRKTTEPSAAEPKGSNSDAVRAALEAHPDKMPKQIAEILQAQGLDVTPQLVSTTKFNLKAKKDKPAATKAAAKEAPASKTGDAVSLDSLKKAKELATQLGGIKQAKAAIAALAELVD
jgi:Arc/MetJ-type ribon-helix-helix transcriptional regulator